MSGARHQNKVRLVVYPGEFTRLIATEDSMTRVTMGHLYVVGGNGESFEIAGGPAPGHRKNTGGGHFADITPPGKYTLGPKWHVRTKSWPMSVIPWGAPLRDRNRVVEYFTQGRWHQAGGVHGDVTQAVVDFNARDHQRVSAKDADAALQSVFYDRDHHLIRRWKLNDFGAWGWNLRSHGQSSPYYLHTTPANEQQATAPGGNVILENSHGCIHISPLDRDRMMALGYLEEGTELEVKPYGAVGPPK